MKENINFFAKTVHHVNLIIPASYIFAARNLLVSRTLSYRRIVPETLNRILPDAGKRGKVNAEAVECTAPYKAI